MEGRELTMPYHPRPARPATTAAPRYRPSHRAPRAFDTAGAGATTTGSAGAGAGVPAAAGNGPAAAASMASTSSEVDANRPDGGFARHRLTMPATAAGTS